MKKKSFKELFDQAKRRDTYCVASLILDFTEGLHKMMEANEVSEERACTTPWSQPCLYQASLEAHVKRNLSEDKSESGGQIFNVNGIWRER